MLTLTADTMRHVSSAILEALGTPRANAESVAGSLVEANLVGHDSHGVIRLIRYDEFVQGGHVIPGNYPQLHERNGARASVDGAWGWGQLAARLATQTVMELATEYGVGAVTIGRCNHIGRLGEYVETLARAGMVGIALCNAAPAVSPYGGFQRIMGTNPLAWAAPRGPGQNPLVLDFASSAVAEGKLRLALVAGEQVPSGLLVDGEGHPSQNPADFYSGGALLPFGAHKGYGISVMIEMLGRALSGVDSASPGYRGANGTLIIALNTPAFVPIEHYIKEAETLCATIGTSPASPGFDRVLLPGEPEMLTRQRRLMDGIPISEQTWEAILALAARLHAAIN